MREVFAQPGYGRLWAARTVSQWDHTLNVVALALLVYDLTESGLGVSGVVVAEIVPVLLLAPVADPLGDRWPRVRVMIGSDVSRLVLAAIWRRGTTRHRGVGRRVRHDSCGRLLQPGRLLHAPGPGAQAGAGRGQHRHLDRRRAFLDRPGANRRPAGRLPRLRSRVRGQRGVLCRERTAAAGTGARTSSGRAAAWSHADWAASWPMSIYGIDTVYYLGGALLLLLVAATAGLVSTKGRPSTASMES